MEIFISMHSLCFYLLSHSHPPQVIARAGMQAKETVLNTYNEALKTYLFISRLNMLHIFMGNARDVEVKNTL